MIPLIAVVGPTASGKTGLAVEIALKYGGEVVSCDSMQVYRGMDIGTAKPGSAEMKGVPHHMMSIIEPAEDYSVARYVETAREVIKNISSRSRLPVLAGGTGLYYTSLADNVNFAESGRDPVLRQKLLDKAAAGGGEKLLEILKQFDPQTASVLHPNNTGRIIRAIEIYKTTGITMSEAVKRSKERPPCYNLCAIGLFYSDRSALYKKTDSRVDSMIAAGLEGEVRRLLESGAPEDSTAMQAIGYKELAGYIKGETTLEEAIDAIKLSTRHYAKRQMTWFRRDKRINWIDITAAGEENISEAAFDIIDKCGLM